MSVIRRSTASGSAQSDRNARRLGLNPDAASELERGKGRGIFGMLRHIAGAGCKRRSRHAELGHSPHAVVGKVPRRRTALRAASYTIIACMMMSQLVMAIAPHAQPYPDVRKNMSAERFNFRYFEKLPKDRRIPEAQAEVERLFPPGSKADDFESYFIASGAKCGRGTDSHGPFLGCIYSMQGLSLVSTDWTVGARLDSTLSKITTVLVTRYITGL